MSHLQGRVNDKGEKFLENSSPNPLTGPGKFAILKVRRW